MDMESEASNEPQLTAMQIAWQEALEKSKGHNKVRRKSIKTNSEDQEELLSITLENRLPTGG